MSHERGSPNGFGGRANGLGGHHHLQPRIPNQAGSPLGPPPPLRGRHVRFAPTPQSPATPNGYQLPSPATVAAPPPPPMPARARPTTLERPPSPMPQPASPLYHDHVPNNNNNHNGEVRRVEDLLLLRDHGDDGDDDEDDIDRVVAELREQRPDLQFVHPSEQEQEERYQSRRRYASESGAGNRKGESITGMLNNFSRALGKSQSTNRSCIPILPKLPTLIRSPLHRARVKLAISRTNLELRCGTNFYSVPCHPSGFPSPMGKGRQLNGH